MKFLRSLLTLVLLPPSFAFAQGVIYQGSPVINGVGQPIAGASVAITNVNPCGTAPSYAFCNGSPNGIYTGPTPPLNLATIYTDINLSTAAANPVSTDGFGNWILYLAAGNYWATIYGNRIVTQVFGFTAGGGGSFSQGTASTVGWQAISPSSPELDIPPDPTETCSYNPNILTSGQFKICNPGNGQLWGDPGSGPLLFLLPQIPTGTPVDGAVPQYVALKNDYEILPLPPTSVLPSAQTFAAVPDVSTGSDNYTCWGMFASQCINDTKNSFAHLNPTGSNGWGRTLTSAASGSTSTVLGMHSTENGSNSLAGIVSFSRLAQKIQINNTTNARWWIGICVWNSGSSLGSNSAQCDGTTAYAANLPNKTTMGFRLSGGTDSTWQCVSIVAGSGSPTSTVVDTLITPDITAPHTYEIDTNANGTALYCLIDRVTVASITTNLPAPGSTADTWGSPFWTGDNENTATAISATWYSTIVSYK